MNLKSKDYKAANVNMFKELKETTLIEIKENIIVSHQIEYINKEIEIFLNNKSLS